MSDLALLWSVSSADLSLSANDLLTDEGLRTSIVLSLATDRRAEAWDALPDGQSDRRGWWGDAVLPAVPNDRIGCRLWLLGREKDTAIVQVRAREYVAEALQWLIDDKVAARVDVTTEIVSRGVLAIGVTVVRPALDPVEFRYNFTWAAEAAR